MSIDHEDFVKKVTTLFSTFLHELSELEKKQPGIHSEDVIRSELDNLLENRVGEPFSQKELDDMYNQGKSRYERRQPPGYMDMVKSKKDDDQEDGVYTYRGLVIRREFGDLILWNQILKEAKERQIKNIIFVTDDEKEDWWQYLDYKGRKIISPRPELIEELHMQSGVELFHMYNSEKFIEYASTYLKIAIKPGTVEQVRDVVDIHRETIYYDQPRLKMTHMAISAVLPWLEEEYPQDKLLITDEFPPFEIIRTDHVTGKEYGYDIKFFNTYSESVFLKTLYTIKMYIYDASLANMVLVFTDDEDVSRAEEVLKERYRDRLAHITYILGTLKLSDLDKPTFNFSVSYAI